MQQIPLQAVPSQTRKVVLDGQNFQILIYTKTVITEDQIFVDVNVDDVEINSGRIALNLVPLISRTYMGARGNLYFIDTQGLSDPIYTGLGTRYQLIYLTEAEYAIAQQL
jgi:hypothetical protein